MDGADGIARREIERTAANSRLSHACVYIQIAIKYTAFSRIDKFLPPKDVKLFFDYNCYYTDKNVYRRAVIIMVTLLYYVQHSPCAFNTTYNCLV